eukprot:m.143580 g.143580  ORF g.143580 m.143580 type:complete len:832 (+) comp16742_c4_seq2:1498-3993(+)
MSCKENTHNKQRFLLLHFSVVLLHVALVDVVLGIEARRHVQGVARQIGLLVDPLRVDALVEAEQHRVVGLELAVKDALHVPVGTEALLDVAAAAVLGHQLHGLEPVDVVRVEEHVADDGRPLVDFVGMAGEADTLDDEAVWVNSHHGSRANQADVCGTHLPEHQDGRRGKVDRGKARCHRDGARLPVALKLVLAAQRRLREDGVGRVAADTRREDERVLGLDRLCARVEHADAVVANAHLVFVAEQAEDSERHAALLRGLGKGRRHVGNHQRHILAGRDPPRLRVVGRQGALLCAVEVLKLEDACIVLGQLLLGVPRRGAEALQAAVLGKAHAGRLVQRRVDLVGERLVLAGAAAEGAVGRLVLRVVLLVVVAARAVLVGVGDGDAVDLVVVGEKVHRPLALAAILLVAVVVIAVMHGRILAILAILVIVVLTVVALTVALRDPGCLVRGPALGHLDGAARACRLVCRVHFSAGVVTIVIAVVVVIVLGHAVAARIAAFVVQALLCLALCRAVGCGLGGLGGLGSLAGLLLLALGLVELLLGRPGLLAGHRVERDGHLQRLGEGLVAGGQDGALGRAHLSVVLAGAAGGAGVCRGLDAVNLEAAAARQVDEAVGANAVRTADVACDAQGAARALFRVGGRQRLGSDGVGEQVAAGVAPGNVAALDARERPEERAGISLAVDVKDSAINIQRLGRLAKDLLGLGGALRGDLTEPADGERHRGHALRIEQRHGLLAKRAQGRGRCRGCSALDEEDDVGELGKVGEGQEVALRTGHQRRARPQLVVLEGDGRGRRLGTGGLEGVGLRCVVAIGVADQQLAQPRGRPAAITAAAV